MSFSWREPFGSNRKVMLHLARGPIVTQEGVELIRFKRMRHHRGLVQLPAEDVNAVWRQHFEEDQRHERSKQAGNYQDGDRVDGECEAP